MHDRNAIDIRHPNRGIQIGNLTKPITSQLSPLLDSKLITVEGVAYDSQYLPLFPPFLPASS